MRIDFTKTRYVLLTILFISLFSACVKDEGEGGTGTVEGFVYRVIHSKDTYTFRADTFPAAKESVYIIYGNSPIYGDKMDAGYDGFFRFRYLTKGQYTVYAFSNNIDGSKTAVFDTVTIGSGATGRTKNIYIHEGTAYETSFIKGTVLVTYVNKKNGVPFDIDKTGAGTRVYIREEGNPYQFDEIRAGFDGVFIFQKILPGKYEVFTLTEIPMTEVVKEVIAKVTVTKAGEMVTIATPLRITINI